MYVRVAVLLAAQNALATRSLPTPVIRHSASAGIFDRLYLLYLSLPAIIHIPAFSTQSLVSCREKVTVGKNSPNAFMSLALDPAFCCSRKMPTSLALLCRLVAIQKHTTVPQISRVYVKLLSA